MRSVCVRNIVFEVKHFVVKRSGHPTHLKTDRNNMLIQSSRLRYIIIINNYYAIQASWRIVLCKLRNGWTDFTELLYLHFYFLKLLLILPNFKLRLDGYNKIKIQKIKSLPVTSYSLHTTSMANKTPIKNRHVNCLVNAMITCI